MTINAKLPIVLRLDMAEACHLEDVLLYYERTHREVQPMAATLTAALDSIRRAWKALD